MFLDNTACNLASTNLLKFLITDLGDDRVGKIDVDSFIHANRLLTIVLEISVAMALHVSTNNTPEATPTTSFRGSHRRIVMMPCGS